MYLCFVCVYFVVVCLFVFVGEVFLCFLFEFVLYDLCGVFFVSVVWGFLWF